jgi:hypothetical protein
MMKLNKVLSSLAVVGLVLGMPAVSMANSGEAYSVQSGENGGGFKGWASGMFRFDKMGAKANLGFSLEARLGKIISRFDANKDRHIGAYNRLASRLAKLETKLEEKGYDTTQLEADLVVLDEKIAKFSVDYSAYIDALRIAKTKAEAGDKEGAKAQIEVAKGLLAVAKVSGQDIRAYYFQTIKVEIKALKNS